jgi:hypothetical protein
LTSKSSARIPFPFLFNARENTYLTHENGPLIFINVTPKTVDYLLPTRCIPFVRVIMIIHSIYSIIFQVSLGLNRTPCGEK